MTATETKRKKFPARYIHKDARTAIFRAVFGSYRGKSNVPALDKRTLAVDWDYQNAEATFRANIDAADFPLSQRKELERKLEQLRHYRRKEVAGDND